MEKLEFEKWLKEPATQKIHKHIQNIINIHTEQILNPELMVQPDTEKLIAYKLGIKDALERVLNLEAEDIDEVEDEEESL